MIQEGQLILKQLKLVITIVSRQVYRLYQRNYSLEQKFCTEALHSKPSSHISLLRAFGLTKNQDEILLGLVGDGGDDDGSGGGGGGGVVLAVVVVVVVWWCWLWCGGGGLPGLWHRPPDRTLRVWSRSGQWPAHQTWQGVKVILSKIVHVGTMGMLCLWHCQSQLVK